MTIASPVRPDGDESVRLALVDLQSLYARHDPNGVSGAEMARAIGVSPQQMQRILDGERRLHPGQIVKLPSRAFRAVMVALETVRGEASGRSTECEASALVSASGDALSEIGKALSDGNISAKERPAIRHAVTTVIRQGEAVVRSLDLVEQKERMVAS